ncbi:hypothetical protein [Taylorella equigenitalis]|uniref:Lipoprotein n=1 Tax=Taylorella equigenitalis 14/56 TaxID=1091497 RepID=I7JQ17_9BURK|nr:hypothetical protein [Taylorella equigenitalis]ASY29850.1 hypothetical protein B9Z30_00245 [Taylorella equigenitalis]ASY37154.1 hypothetical protein CA605_00245 [Taylorella equigenitalis]ASY40144.1 hypothetical protein CAV20_00245 [Taylorella equigenitalis]ASY41579.1 hypothetical protein CA943_00245 [Taylorella equigenitalis]KGK33641.1 hypothetical protein LW90_03330 [Taylorella equigenitalis]
MTLQLKHTLAFIFLLFAFACTQYQPVVDRTGVDEALLRQHKLECEMYYKEAQKDPAILRGLTTAFPYVMLGVTTDFMADSFRGYTGDHWTIVGTVIGLIAGTLQSMDRDNQIRRSILDQCLASKGYQIYHY